MRKYILDIPVDYLWSEEVLATVADYCRTNKPHLITTPYASFWYWAQRDDEFLAALKNADLSLPDGIGIVAATKFLGKSFSDNLLIRLYQMVVESAKVSVGILSGKIEDERFSRVTGVDIMLEVLTLSEKEGWRVFFLGGWPASLSTLESRIKKDFPRLLYQCDVGSLDVKGESGARDLDQAVEKINQFEPHVLFVAFGPPFQEKWAFSQKLRISANAIFCVGASFDLLSGQLKRAPKFLRRLGLEWVWRLLTQPTRIRRILAAFPYFPLLVARYILKRH